MKQTLTQKVLARAAGRSSVEQGAVVWSKVDITLSTHDAGGLSDLDFKLAAAIENVAGR